LLHDDFAVWSPGYGKQLNHALPRAVFHCCEQFAVGGQTPIPHRTRLKLCEWLSAPPFRIKTQHNELADVREVRRVLVFDDFDEIASPGIALLDQGIFAAVSHSRYQIEWYRESLEANLFTDEASQRRILDGYIRKYKDRKPDLIIAVGPSIAPVHG
jgi:hypothetical protein